MADLKISQLTDGNPAQTSDQIPINRGGANFSITAGSISALPPTTAGANQVLFVDSAGTSVDGFSGFTFDGSTLANNAGTLTTDKKVLDLSATWNSVGTTFTGLKLNVTDTASASGSLLLDVQKGGTSQLVLNKSGNLGLGVTPSAWSLFVGVIDQSWGSLASTTNQTNFTFNAYWNGTNWIHVNTGWTSQYRQSGGAHTWYTGSGSLAAGSTSVFTERATVGSASFIINDPGNDYDFRVEGDTDANLFFVDASTDRVGIGTNTPAAKLELFNGQGTQLSVRGTSTRSSYSVLSAFEDDANAGKAVWGSNAYAETAYADTLTRYNTLFAGWGIIGSTSTSTFESTNCYLAFRYVNPSGTNTERMRLDSSGNLGLGVTPSAGAVSSTFQSSLGVFVGNTEFNTGANAYFTGSDWKYINTGVASRYSHAGATHLWYTANSNTAGNTVTWIERFSARASSLVINDPGNDYDFRVEGDTDANLFFVDASTDRVGIGTNAPGEKLQVNGTIRSLGTTGASSPRINLVSAGFWTWGIYGDGNTLKFQNDSSDRLTLDSSGNLGIGATSTTSALRILRSGGAEISLCGGNNAQASEFYIAQADAATSYVWNRASGPIVFGTANIERARLDTSSFVVNDPGADYDFRVEGDTDANLFFVDASTDRVGIGTNAPAYKLAVAGTLYASDARWATGGYTIGLVGNDSNIVYSGGDANITGGWISLYGSSHPSAASVVAFGRGNGSSSTESMRLDSSGNLGLGVTPSAWTATGAKAFQVGDYGALVSATQSNGYTDFTFNLYENYRYLTTNFASFLRQRNGNFQFFTAPSGTAGAVPVFSERLTVGVTSFVVNEDGADYDFRVEGDTDANLLFVDASTDRVGIGTNAPAAKLQVNDGGVRIFGTTNAATRLTFFRSGNSVGSIWQETQGLRFGVDGSDGTTLQMFLNTSGNLGLGTDTFGTSAAGVFAIKNGTEPSTGPADTVQIYSVDRSAGNTIPAIYCEGSGVTNAGITDVAVTNKIAIKVNGTVYYLLATTVAT